MINLKYLSLILNTDYKNWPELYQNIGQILEESLEEFMASKGIFLNEKIKFFGF